MYCNKCGRQIADGAAFCPGCGQKLGAVSGDMAEKEKRHHVGRRAIAGILAGGAVVIAAVAAVFFAIHRDKPEQQASVVADIAERTAMAPLYNIQDVEKADLAAQNHTPMDKQPGMAWDSTLFYWLEDIDLSSAEDGNIAGCRLTKTLLRDERTGQLVRYEVYSDPESGEIYKIVSIEETEGGLRLTDYYYKNGSPDFIFQREDTVYTPTYATIEKTGERYYFNNEVMVRWRFIREPGVVGEYTLAPEDVWYVQSDYFAESGEVQRAYDDKEREMLNAAHNTYDAVTGSRSIGLVEGRVQDTAGRGMAGRKVRMYRREDDTLLYEAVTDEAGAYSIFVYLDDTDCYVRTEGDGEYREALMQGICLDPSSASYTCSLTLHRDSGDEYPVDIRAYSCGNTVPADSVTLQGVRAVFREGAGNYGGEAVCTVEMQDGVISAALLSGVYTVQLSAEGYLDSYTEIEVLEHAAAGDAYLMPALGEGQTGILLTWEGGETDLDLTLFTPYRAESGDMAHIGGAVAGDAHGNMLVADNSSGYEMMLLETGTQGIYKVYVNDYTDSLAGKYDSDALRRLNVHIYIYDSDGLAAAYTPPVGQNGVVWEVAEISGRNVTPSQRLYTNISGKDWWTADKEALRAAEDRALLEKLQSGDSRLSGLMETLMHFLSEEEINMLLRGEAEGIKAFYGLDGYYAPAVELPWVADNAAAGELAADLDRQRRTDDDWWIYLTEQQAGYLLRSINGKQTDMDLTGYAGWVEPYIGLSYGAEVEDGCDFKVRSLNRVSPDVWEITGYSVRSSDHVPPEVCRVCFTVIRNPDSCFEGYSLLHYEVEESAPTTDWAQIYYDYLTADPDFSQMLSELSEDDLGRTLINWCYIDDDMIPELCLEVSVLGGYKALLYIAGQEVQSLGSNVEVSLEVKPFTGFFKEATGMSAMMPEGYYYLNDGEITYLGTRYLNGNEEGDILYSLGESGYGEANASREEFEETMKRFAGTEDWEFHEDEYESYYFTSDYEETLSCLQELCAR